MRRLRTCFAMAVLAGGVITIASPVNAVLLSDLVNPQSPQQLRQIEIGDKLFDNFTVAINGVPNYEANPANIQVTGINPGGVFGLQFAPVSLTAPMIFAHPGAFVDVLISFDVTVTDPAFKISSLNLSFSGNAPSNGLAQIVETAYGDSDPPVLLQVSTLGSATATAPLAHPYSKIRVYKDIVAVAGTESSAAINGFTQLFIQVPEPATASLLVLGGLVVFGRHRGRRRTVLAAAIGLGLAGLLMQPSTASAVALSSLDNNPSASFAFKDFTFSNFDFNVVGSSGKWIADPVAIDVQGFTTPDGSEDGLRFAGLIAALSNVTASSSVTIALSYDVTVKPGAHAIHDLSMSFNGVPTAGDGIASVSKTILYQGGSVGGVQVWNQPANQSEPLRLQDHTVLSGGPYTTTIRVNDQIIVNGGQSGATTISFISQTFSQIPEPAALALLAVGMPALLYRRKR